MRAELSNRIAGHQLTQADAAQVRMVSRRRVSGVVNQTAKFTIDSLVEMPSRVAKPVRRAVDRNAAGSVGCQLARCDRACSIASLIWSISSSSG